MERARARGIRTECMTNEWYDVISKRLLIPVLVLASKGAILTRQPTVRIYPSHWMNQKGC